MPEESDMTGEEAIERGYRRISNKYRIVSRIDREDWLDLMAKHINRPVADFYNPNTGVLSGLWADYYRRCVSEDCLVLSPGEFHKVPSSNGDPCGYVEGL